MFGRESCRMFDRESRRVYGRAHIECSVEIKFDP